MIKIYWKIRLYWLVKVTAVLGTTEQLNKALSFYNWAILYIAKKNFKSEVLKQNLKKYKNDKIN